MHLLPLRWPHEWPKCVSDRYIIKLHSSNQSAFVSLLTDCIHQINARYMEHLKLMIRPVSEVNFVNSDMIQTLCND